MNLAQFLADRSIGIEDAAPIDMRMPRWSGLPRSEMDPASVREILRALRRWGPCTSNTVAAKLNRSRNWTRALIVRCHQRSLVKRTEARVKGIVRYTWEAFS